MPAGSGKHTMFRRHVASQSYPALWTPACEVCCLAKLILLNWSEVRTQAGIYRIPLPLYPAVKTCSDSGIQLSWRISSWVPELRVQSLSTQTWFAVFQSDNFENTQYKDADRSNGLDNRLLTASCQSGNMLHRLRAEGSAIQEIQESCWNAHIQACLILWCLDFPRSMQTHMLCHFIVATTCQMQQVLVCQNVQYHMWETTRHDCWWNQRDSEHFQTQYRHRRADCI